jgi:hypothetical protein
VDSGGVATLLEILLIVLPCDAQEETENKQVDNNSFEETQRKSLRQHRNQRKVSPISILLTYFFMCL